MSYSKTLVPCCLLLLLSATTSAQVSPGVQACKADSNSVYCLCRDGRQKPDAAVFPELASAAVTVREQFCGGLLSRDAVSSLVLDFVSENQSWETAVGGFDGNLSKTIVQASLFQGAPIGLTDAFINDANEVVIRVLDKRFVVKNAVKCAALIDGGGSDVVRCERAVQAFVDTYAYAQKTYSAFDEYLFSKNIGELRVKWDNYFERSRGMTSLELVINSGLHRRDETTRFSGPPERQWVFLHPQLVIENVSAAADGEQIEEALALEIVGLNYWRQDRWYVPSGGSIVMLYSDKATTDDVGMGVQLYFKSAYSIGYSNRGGDSGVFISFDLFKLFRDKRSELSAFLE